MATNVVRGNVQGCDLFTATLTPASVANATTAEQTFTITGLSLGNWIYVVKPSTQAGLGIVNCRVSAANTLAIAFANVTATTITPTAAEVYTIVRISTSDQPIPSGYVP